MTVMVVTSALSAAIVSIAKSGATRDAAVIVAVTAAAGLAGGIARRVLRPPVRLATRVAPYTVEACVELGREPQPPGVRTVSALDDARRGPSPASLVAWLGRLVEARSDEALGLALVQAGWRTTTPDALRARQVVFAIAGAAGGAVVGIAAWGPGVAPVLGSAMGFLAGAARARADLERAVAARAQRLRLELFTVNQVLAMHVRTGAGPVQAVQHVVRRGRGVIVEELQDLLDALRHGVPEAEAFRRAASLTPEPAAARTYALFATAAERGSDLAPALRALTVDLRDARREQLRKHALTRRAAMLVPTIAVLAPIMLLFIAAPIPSLIFGAR